MLALILYFSGTGNTRNVAFEFEKALRKRHITVEIHSVEETEDYANLQYDLLIIGFPKYYEYPVLNILNYVKCKLPRRDKIIPTLAYCTQAGPLPTDFSKLGRLLKQKNHILTISKSFPYANNMMIFSAFKFTDPIKMDENIRKIQQQIEPLVSQWLNGDTLIEKISKWKRPLFHFVAIACTKCMPVLAMRFSVSQDCTHCGLCAKQCPANNIQMTETGPIFQKHCLFCMRCINSCPVNAIVYNNRKCRQYNANRFRP